MDDYIIKDSSIWMDPADHSLRESADATIKMGIVRDVVAISEDSDISYICDVWLGGKYTSIQCFRTSRFGGVYNFEEYNHRGFELDNDPTADSLMDYKQGDAVIIAYLMGESNTGVILGGLNHPGRPKIFKPDDDIAYQSEFNGVNKSINKDGEYTVTFKGQPTNISVLSDISKGQPIPPAEYNEEIGSSYYQFDKDGSYTLSDNATDGEQKIKVDKKNGKIEIIGGKTSFTITKEDESYVIKNKITTFEAADEFNIKTKVSNVDASKEANIKAAKINTTGELTQTGNVAIKGNTAQTGNVDVNGNFSSSGTTSLAGGANPLIYEIILIKGTGNKGAPVISTATVLKTALTKAT